MTAKRLLVSVSIAALMPAAALAQQVEDAGWQYRVAPYLWGSATEGHFAHARLPVELHTRTSFRDLLDDLELGAMGRLEARRGRHGGLVDGQFAKLSTTLQAPVAGAAIPVHLKTRSATALLAYQYRLRSSEHFHLDAIAGVRAWSARVRVAYAVAAPLPPPVPSRYAAEQQARWVDLQLGLKGRYGLSNGMFVGGWALAGAGESDLSTDVMLLAGYDFGPRVSIVAGYRWLSTDYAASNGFRFDTSMSGPGLGLEYRF